MIVNPGIRRFLGSAIQRLFNSASVSLPLTHTAIPTRGSITPSFTRATTETGQKWDEAGYLDFTALAGEMVFKGARREYNQWTTSSVSLASGANKSLTLAAGTYQFSMGAGTGTATFSGTGGATGTLGASASDRVSVAKTITAGTFVVTASVADLADLQVCNITGETDQTTIRPYVSVGVPSDWAGPEYLTNGDFSNGTTGWTAINSASLAVASGELTVTCGAVSNGTAEQAYTTVVGAKYVVSATVRSGGAYAAYIVAGATSGAFGLGFASTTSTSNVLLTFEFTATGTTTYIGCRNTAGVGFTGIYDNISVKPAIYHGSMVDGVKCYDTDRSGNPISTSGSYPIVGYVPWEARTNLVWPSEDLTSVRYVSGGGGIAVVADQAVAPDGTTTADQLTASGANGTLIQDLGVIASTAQCFSLHLKRKTGTGNIDITLDGGATWTTQTINSTTWTRCEKTQTLANPDVGIRIVTSGDAVYAWGLQCE